MRRVQRLAQIMNILKAEGSVSSRKLAQLLSVSDVTIRKDLNFLAEEGKVERTFGGAALLPGADPVHTVQAEPLSFFSNLKIDESYFPLARMCLEYIEPDDNIFLGSGGTCCALAQLLPDNMNLSVVTNSLSALPFLIEKRIKVFLVGGEVATVDNNTYFSSISEPAQYLKSVRTNKAFTSCYGLNISAGITVNSAISSYIFRVLPDIVQNWYMLAGDEKFGRVGMYEVSPMRAIHRIICYHVPPEFSQYCSEAGIGITQVKEPNMDHRTE